MIFSASKRGDDADPAGAAGVASERADAERARWVRTLRFPAPLERKFAAQYNQQAVPFVRVVLLVGFGVVAAFGTLLFGLTPRPDPLLWWQYGFVCPVMLLLFGLTFWRGFPRIIQYCIGGGLLTNSLGFILLYAFLPPESLPPELRLDDPTRLHLLNSRFCLYLTAAYGLARLRFVPSVTVGWTLLAVHVACVELRLPLPNETRVNALAVLGAFTIVGMLTSYFNERSARRDFLLAQLLGEERDRSEELLLNILPASIADRLKGGEGQRERVADSFGEVTVLFADIVGFTQLSSRVSPEALVDLLNDIFSRFDDLVDAYSLEKIKTIGDAYMLVGGLPEPRPNHARAVAEVAVAMLAAVESLSRERGVCLEVRIGIHSGPVVAGVIGRRKFIYDLWGDTVNLASRLESHGTPGRIHVTGATRALLGDHFEFEERGEIDLKGRGRVPTFFLKARTGSESGSAAGARPG